jgi:hypothetical protein
VALLLWLILSGAGLLFSRHTPRSRGLVAGSSEYLVLVVLMFGLVVLLTPKRPVIDLAQRAQESSIARGETLAMWASMRWTVNALTAYLLQTPGRRDRASVPIRRKWHFGKHENWLTDLGGPSYWPQFCMAKCHSPKL